MWSARGGGANRQKNGEGPEPSSRGLRVDEDDVGVALHGLGEDGAGDAAADHHHPGLPRPRGCRHRFSALARAAAHQVTAPPPANCLTAAHAPGLALVNQARVGLRLDLSSLRLKIKKGTGCPSASRRPLENRRPR